MKHLRITDRQRKLLAAALVQRLEHWRWRRASAQEQQDLESATAATDYLTDYAQLLGLVAGASEAGPAKIVPSIDRERA